MQAQVQEYEHSVSGSRHIHLATDDPEMVFVVGFPTFPDTSDGRAHILEHLTLSGSAKYPVRDPFFAMLRRSTAHFMNAMTYPDKTVYPFASTNKTDFFNLLDVYLDAVFFPRLDYLDFLQEGWRLTLDTGKLGYHGVVLNEMKGAFADPLRALAGGISSHLLKGTTYAVESGGDPLDIPGLTHTALQEFHAEHYHPSQAVFMTAGRIDPQEVQQAIQQRVLSGRPERQPWKLPQVAPAWLSPAAATIEIPGREHGVQISWLMGESADPIAYYHAKLLEAGLLSNASAPLARVMESSGFGRPSALNGVDADGRQMVFHLGMEGLTQDQVRQARKRIWSALEKTASEGVPQSILHATLRDIRYYQREIDDDDTPHALTRLLQAMPYVMYGGDIMDAFDEERVLAQLQHEIGDPDFFKGLVRALLASPTRLDATVVPDPHYVQSRKKIEDERLAALHASLSQAQAQRLLAEAAALLERQRQPADNDVLPRIHPHQVSPSPRPALCLPDERDGAIAVAIPSNGISYAQVLYDMSDLEETAWPWLQLYVELLPELGVGRKSYEDADAWRHERVPFFDVGLQVLQAQDAARSLRMHVAFQASGLREENRAIADVLSETIRAARFDEHERLAFLIDSMVQDMRNDLADRGDEYARLSAIAPLSPMRYFEHRVQGSDSFAFYRGLHRLSQTKQGLQEIGRQLAQLHRRIIQRTPVVITAGMEDDARCLAGLLELPPPSPQAGQAPGAFAGGAPALSNRALYAPAQVNHCFAAWAAPGLAHPDAPALAVLAELLTNLVLHQALREEGGAYGGHAGYSAETGAFVMMSYRDPRVAATYGDFEKAIAWVLDTELQQEHIEEAIICVIRDLDHPLTPYAQVMSAWEQQQQGITEAMRRQYRQGVLQCTAQAIRNAAAAWLRGKPCSRSAFVGNSEQDLAGLEVADLQEWAN